MPEQQLTCSKKCAALKRRKVDRPSDDVLIQQIKEMGYTAVGEMYGVSDVAVRKWVGKYRVRR